MPITSSDMQMVDELCDRFESEWKAGSASIEEYLAQAPAACREILLVELAAVELNYRRSSPTNDDPQQELLNAHPGLADELAECLLKESNNSTAVSPHNFSSDVVLVNDSKKRSLTIRCPNCRGSVEFLADTPQDEVTCRSCGSEFSLAGKEEGVANASCLRTFGRFELISRLGVGGFGTVWQARDTELDRTVALKIPRRGQMGSSEVDYFFREARAAAQLQHPNIVAVHEIGHEDDTVFIVSDFVQGVTLAEWMEGNRPSYLEAAELCITIAAALHHAHQRGVIHRDLKPSNVMIDITGQARIMDFGLAKRDTGELTLTMEGQILGTAAYMSPEQAEGKSHWTDCRTDVYSLGVILFQLLTSELPFRGNLETQLYAKQMNDAPDPRKLDRHIPQDLATICLKCLERDPNSRYSSAAEVADELRRFHSGDPIQARPISRMRRAWRWSRQRPALATAIALTAFLALAGPTAALVFQQQRQAISNQNQELIDVVSREQSDKQALSEEKRLLEERINLLEGQFPGVDRIEWDMQKQLIEDVVDVHYKVGSSVPLFDPENQLEQAQYHSAIGFLHAELGRQETAEVHLQQARVALEELLEQQPDNRVLQKALAQCNATLSHNTRDEALAQDASEKSLDLLIKLASEDPAMNTLIDLIEARLEAIGISDSGGSELNRLEPFNDLRDQLVENWPNTPADIYAAACRLTMREAVLEDATETPAEDQSNSR